MTSRAAAGPSRASAACVAAALFSITPGCGDSATDGQGGSGASASSGTMSTSGTTVGAGGGIVGADPGAPVIFYTDLVTAPIGAYVTIWGNGFGDMQGTSSVTLAGGAVDIVSWTMRRLELRIPAGATAGDLVVTTPGGASPGVAFGVHTGNIWFVSPSGDDSFSGSLETTNGGDGPFQTIGRGRDALAPGDVLYIREGTYTGEDQFNAELALYDVAPGSETAPIAIVGYPGERATIGDNTLPRSFSLYTGDGGPPLDWLVIAKLDLRTSCAGLEATNGDHGRFVGNEISGASDPCMNGVISALGPSHWKIFGNYLHDNGNTKFEHGIYLAGYGDQTDWELAYNRIQNQRGGRGIQLYGHIAGDSIAGVSIHDNEFIDVDRDGIVLGGTDGDVLTLSDISIYDNVFVRAGRCAGSGIRVSNDTATNVSILHNTFVDAGIGNMACDQSDGQPIAGIFMEAAVDTEIRNNLFYVTGPQTYVEEQTGPGILTGSNNLFFGAGDAPGWDAAAVSGDPMFVGVATNAFQLSAGSPAIDKGAMTSVAVDHDGVKRPQGSAPDIGAFEWFAPTQ